jgi:hypothetical protein
MKHAVWAMIGLVVVGVGRAEAGALTFTFTSKIDVTSGGGNGGGPDPVLPLVARYSFDPRQRPLVADPNFAIYTADTLRLRVGTEVVQGTGGLIGVESDVAGDRYAVLFPPSAFAPGTELFGQPIQSFGFVLGAPQGTMLSGVGLPTAARFASAAAQMGATVGLASRVVPSWVTPPRAGFRLSAAPEPPAFVLAGMGGLALAGFAWRRRRLRGI